MERLDAILKKLKPGVDFNTEINLIDNKVLDSFEVITLVCEINEAYRIDIDFLELTAKNLNSLDAIKNLINQYL